MLADIIQAALTACDGTVFDSRGNCPLCGGAISGYDTKKKQFAVLLDGKGRHPVHVFVKRFACRECKKVVFADEPFYPGTRIGAPVVDLCITFSATMPFSRAATYLAEAGVAVDRMSVRKFALNRSGVIPTADVFGVRLPISIISLSTLAARLGEGGCIEGAEALAACGFPSAYRTPAVPLFSSKKRNEWDK
jgi:hypothetical protein